MISRDIGERERVVGFVYGSTSVPMVAIAVGLATLMSTAANEAQMWLVVSIMLAAWLMPIVIQFPTVWWRSGNATPVLDLLWRFTIPLAIALITGPMLVERSSLVVQVLAAMSIVSFGMLFFLWRRISLSDLSDPFLWAVSLSCLSLTLVFSQNFESFLSTSTVLSLLYGGSNYLVANALRRLVNAEP